MDSFTNFVNIHCLNFERGVETETEGAVDDVESDAGDAAAAAGSNKYAVACAIIASTISILIGYDTGVMSGAMLFIKEELRIGDGEVGVLAGILNICALAGSLTAGRVSDYFGRRLTIVLAAAIFLLGSLLMGLAPNFAMLLSGRCVAGVGVGYALMIAPVYSAEISSPSTRGSLTSLPELCISFGILLGYIANYFLARLPLAYTWRTMLGIPVLPAAALAAGIFAMPESPRWLVMQGRLKDADAVLQRVCATSSEAEHRLADIKRAAGDTAGAGGKGVWKELLLRPTPPVRRILIAAVGVHFFQHMTGIEAVVLYSPRIFHAAGVVSKNRLLAATMGVGVVKMSFVLVAVFLLDRVGRRPLLLTSLGGMIVSLTLLGAGLTLKSVPMSIGTVFTFVAFFAVGVGPITWTYSSEIFPLRLRAQGASIGVAVNRVMNGSLSMAFIPLYKAITIGGAFFLFAGFGVVAWVFYFCCLPETKGRPLEQMEEVFAGQWGTAWRRPASGERVVAA